ncbi:MAG: cupin domain-containing protein [Alphaproteobacteria bacterium]
MRRLIGTLSLLAVIGAASTAAAGDVYVVDNAQGKRPMVLQKDGFALADVPKIGEGANQGFSYATALELPLVGITVNRGRVEPGGSITAHEGPSAYVLYVVGGTGKLINVDKDGNTTSEIAYKPEDVIVFQPNTLHRWENGGEPFDFVGFEYPQPKR